MLLHTVNVELGSIQACGIVNSTQYCCRIEVSDIQ